MVPVVEPAIWGEDQGRSERVTRALAQYGCGICSGLCQHVWGLSLKPAGALPVNQSPLRSDGKEGQKVMAIPGHPPPPLHNSHRHWKPPRGRARAVDEVVTGILTPRVGCKQTSDRKSTAGITGDPPVATDTKQQCRKFTQSVSMD